MSRFALAGANEGVYGAWVKPTLAFDPEWLEVASGNEGLHCAFRDAEGTRDILDVHERFEGCIPPEQLPVLHFDNFGEFSAEGFDLCGEIGHGVVGGLSAVAANGQRLVEVISVVARSQG